MKNISVTLLVACSILFFSCGENSTSKNIKNADSAYSGLEGTRDEASKLSNATIDTSGGQSVKKADHKDSAARQKIDSSSKK